MLVSSWQVRVCCETTFGGHLQKRATSFDYLHFVLASVHSCVYLVTSPNQLTFQLKSSLYIHLVSDGCIYPFLVVTLLCRRFVSSLFTIAIYPWLAYPPRFLWSYKPEVNWSPSRLSAGFFFFLFFFSLSLSLLSLSLSLSLSPL